MSEETENKQATEDQKTFTQSEVEDLIKKRLQRFERNAESENEMLKQKTQVLEQKLATQSAAQPEQQAQPQQQAPMQQGAEQQQQQEQGNAGQEQAQQQPQLSRDDIMDAMKQSQQQINEQQQVQSAQQHASNVISKMVQDDPKFDELEKKETSYKIPQEVAIYLANQINPNQAKNIFTKLMTSKADHLMMENAFYKEKLGDSGSLDKWLRETVNEHNGDTGSSPHVPPDLSEDAETKVGNDDMANIDNYIRSS